MTNILSELQSPDCYEQLWDYCLEHNIIMPMSNSLAIGNQSARMSNYGLHSGSGRFSIIGYHDNARSVRTRAILNIWSASGRGDVESGYDWSVTESIIILSRVTLGR